MITRLFRRLVRNESGQDLIEYALLGAFVSLAVVAGTAVLGTNLNTWYNAVATSVGGLTTG